MAVRQGSGQVDLAITKILRRYQLKLSFPSEVEREVDRLVAAPGIDDPSLEDLTDLVFVTIDNDDSRDLDQAVLVEQGPGGEGFLVRYALADAAHFVQPGMALFREALRRGVSYYLPGLVVPMLPSRLSEGIISLNPHVERRALVFEADLDREGRCLAVRFRRARIHSRAQLSYHGVQHFYDHPEDSPLGGQEFSESLLLLQEAGRRLQDHARERDVVQFSRTETVVELDGADERRFKFVVDERNDASLWNEQISLLCNIEGGKLLAESPLPHVQPIYRVHQAPSPESLEHLSRIIDHLLRLHPLDAELWRWRRTGPRAQSLADYLEGLPHDPATERVRQAVEQQIMVINQRSHYSSEPGRHYALGVQPYSRFTAPMREIVGIFTHKEALEKLGLIEPAATAAADEEIREQIIASANGAKERQNKVTKEVTKLAVDELLEGDLSLPLAERPGYRGTIIEIRPTRMYVQLDHPSLALKVYVDQLEARLGLRYYCQGDGLELLPRDRAAGPRFQVGDEITLRVYDCDESGRWELGIP